MQPALHNQIGSYLLWDACAGCPPVLLNVRLLERIRGWAAEQESSGTLLGILLGRNDQAGNMIAIEDCEPISAGQLQPRLSWWASARQRILKPVGLIRIDPQENFSLTPDDLTTLREFPAEKPVFLAVRSGPETKAAVLFPDGDYENTRLFPLEAAALQALGFTILRGREALEVPPEPVPVRPAVPQRRRVRLPSVNPVWAAAATCVLLLILSAAVYSSLRNRPQTEVSRNLGLRVEQAGPALRLRWDPANQAVRDASDGELIITDGRLTRRMDLDKQQLDSGGALYVPEHDDVNFKLQLQAPNQLISDSLRVVEPDMAARAYAKNAPQQMPQQIEQQTAPPTRELDTADRRRTPDVPAEALQPEKPAPTTAVQDLPAAPQPRVVPRGAEPPRAPAELAPRYSFQSAKEPKVAVTFWQAPESGFKHVLRKIPGVRSLSHFHMGFGADSHFTPPRPLTQAQVELPSTLQRSLQSDRRLELELSIDPRGRVRDVVLISPNADRRLVQPAANAMYRSRFEPAVVDGHPVAGHLRVRFHFHAAGAES